MARLHLFCPLCATWVHIVADENCPPSSVRCPCGARYPLEVDEAPLLPLPHGALQAEGDDRVDELIDLAE